MRWSNGFWAICVLLALGAGVGIALWRAPHTVDVPDEPASSGQAPVEAPPQQPAMPAPPVLATMPEPPGVTAERWAGLGRELAGQPQELLRLARYYTFSDALQRYRSHKESLSAAQRLALARTLDSSLDERLRQRELNIGEARLIKVAVLQELLADEAQRTDALVRWQDEQIAAHPPEAAHLAHENNFLQRQAAVVAAWQAQPQALRDPKALERELDALRRAAFTPANDAPKGTPR
jgi:hypothetical protein